MAREINLSPSAAPALWVSIFFGTGIICGTRAPAPLLWIGAAIIAGAVVAATAFFSRREIVTLLGLVSAVGMVIIVVSAGALRITFHRSIPAGDISLAANTLHNTEVVVIGKLIQPPRETASNFLLDMDVESLVTEAGARPARGRLRAVMRKSSVNEMTATMGTIAVGGTLRKLPLQRNPGDFDYGGYLRRQGFGAEVEATYAYVVDDSAPLHRRVLIRARGAVASAIESATPSPGGRAVLVALLLGDRSGLDIELRNNLARTGLMHLLAVSGLHVLLVAMVFYNLLKPMLLRFGVRWRWMESSRAVTTIIILMIYTALTGAGPSVVRASVMAALFMGSTFVQRPVSSMNTLGVAATVLMLWRPEDLFAPGFQLSFGAVAGILLFMPHLRWVEQKMYRTGRVGRYVSNSVMISLAAGFGTLPALLYHFGQAPFAGLALNLVAIPATFGILASGIALVLFHPISAGVASTFGAAADALSQLLLGMAGAGGAYAHYALVETYVRDLPAQLIIVGLILMLAFIHRPRFRWRLAAFTLCVAAVYVWVKPLDRDVMSVIFFDVGQGDAALVTTPNGKNILIDAGPRGFGYDAGERIIAPNLRFLGISRLDVVVISHPHSDHLGGLPYLMRNFAVGEVWHNGHPYESALVAETIHLLDSLSIPHQSVHAGMQMGIDPAIRVDVLAPHGGSLSNVNDASVVLRIRHGRADVLFTGDAEAPSESILATYFGELLTSHLIKAGHHGSSTSSTDPFVRAAGGEKSGDVVISVAERNRYSHPSQDVIDRWTDAGRSVQLTSEAGALWYRSDGRAISRFDWR